MGGFGSGSWYRWQSSKTTVESCRSLDAGRLAREGVIQPGRCRSGRWVWYSDKARERESSSLGYSATASLDGTGSIHLNYRVRLGEEWESLDYSIPLRATRPNFGGLRWWFVCPLIANGRPCRRRVLKLYLSGRYFGCRHCHDLTYRSSQEAHQAERTRKGMMKLIGAYPSLDVDEMSPAEVLTLCKGAFLGDDSFE